MTDEKLPPVDDSDDDAPLTDDVPNDDDELEQSGSARRLDDKQRAEGEDRQR